MMEAGALVGPSGLLYLHTPEGRTEVRLPDSRSLWDLFLLHQKELVGFAHTHPGSGVEACTPSQDDLSSFRAIERGLGRTLTWWILSSDTVVSYTFEEPDTYVGQLEEEPPWAAVLRQA